MILPVPGVCSKANPTLENLQEMDFDQEVEEPETWNAHIQANVDSDLPRKQRKAQGVL